MANQRRLADNLNHYDANRHGVPRQGNALLQGIAICGRCGRRMGLHYSGQNGNYPVYLCRADQHQHGGPRCQEVRALGVDAAVERVLLEALTPDRLGMRSCSAPSRVCRGCARGNRCARWSARRCARSVRRRSAPRCPCQPQARHIVFAAGYIVAKANYILFSYFNEFVSSREKQLFIQHFMKQRQ